MKKTKKKTSPIAKLKKWVKQKIACGNWQASYEEFLFQIRKVEKEEGK
jgi:hypothetical protein